MIVSGAPVLKEIASVAHRNGAWTVGFDAGPDPHGCGHRKKHRTAGIAQTAANLLRRSRAEKASLLHDGHRSGQRQRFFQAVLGQKYGGTQFPVDLAEYRKKIGCGDRIELAGRLVKDENLWLHYHNRRQIQKLLLAAGKRRHVAVKPFLNSEEGGHFRHTAADGGGIISETLQSEGQLVPHLIGDNLILRRLLHEADLRRLPAAGNLLQRCPTEINLSASGAVGRQSCFQLTQKGGFSAAGGAAQDKKVPLRNREGNPGKRGLFLLRILKAVI